jgi:hypothetical protein
MDVGAGAGGGVVSTPCPVPSLPCELLVPSVPVVVGVTEPSESAVESSVLIGPLGTATVGLSLPPPLEPELECDAYTVMSVPSRPMSATQIVASSGARNRDRDGAGSDAVCGAADDPLLACVIGTVVAAASPASASPTAADRSSGGAAEAPRTGSGVASDPSLPLLSASVFSGPAVIRSSRQNAPRDRPTQRVA